jgi:hypothetical protein
VKTGCCLCQSVYETTTQLFSDPPPAARPPPPDATLPPRPRTREEAWTDRDTSTLREGTHEPRVRGLPAATTLPGAAYPPHPHPRWRGDVALSHHASAGGRPHITRGVCERSPGPNVQSCLVGSTGRVHTHAEGTRARVVGVGVAPSMPPPPPYAGAGAHWGCPMENGRLPRLAAYIPGQQEPPFPQLQRPLQSSRSSSASPSKSRPS